LPFFFGKNTNFAKNMEMKHQILSDSPYDLPEVAAELLKTHPMGRVFAIYGKMGAGKTTFIKAFCTYLGVTETVNSPTFALVNQYITRDGENIFHFDFYRIKKIEEVLDIGYEDYFYSNNFCLIEWPEKIEALLPPDVVRVEIVEDEDSGKRFFTF
jgi:tRNA threonylcarbamoyladenosine biosynthesis protein TsaE